jgi:hypothetical protein
LYYAEQIEVFDITLPLTPSLPTFWGVAARDNPSIWGATASSLEFTERFADFLLDHRVPVSSLYGGASDWTSTGMYRYVRERKREAEGGFC